MSGCPSNRFLIKEVPDLLQPRIKIGALLTYMIILDINKKLRHLSHTANGMLVIKLRN